MCEYINVKGADIYRVRLLVELYSVAIRSAQTRLFFQLVSLLVLAMKSSLFQTL